VPSHISQDHWNGDRMNRQHEPSRRVDGPPEVGYYLVKSGRKMPWVGAEIRYSALSGWRAIINGDPCGNPHHDWVMADGVSGIWFFGKRLTETEFRKLRRVAAPNLPIDPNAEPAVF